MRSFLLSLLLLLWLSLAWLHHGQVARAAGKPVQRVDLADLALENIATPVWPAQKNQSISGTPLQIGHRRFRQGIGLHAPSEIQLHLGSSPLRFLAYVGVDNRFQSASRKAVDTTLLADDLQLFVEQPAGRFLAYGRNYPQPYEGAVHLQIWGDEVLLWEKTGVKKGDKALRIDLDLMGFTFLRLLALPGPEGPEGDKVDWAEARILYRGESPQILPIRD
ncbi:MAG: NPCBM/NEW2 domain-containing protein [Bacteroidota bacterium]